MHFQNDSGGGRGAPESAGSRLMTSEELVSARYVSATLLDHNRHTGATLLFFSPASSRTPAEKMRRSGRWRGGGAQLNGGRTGRATRVLAQVRALIGQSGKREPQRDPVIILGPTVSVARVS